MSEQSQKQTVREKVGATPDNTHRVKASRDLSSIDVRPKYLNDEYQGKLPVHFLLSTNLNEKST